MGYLSIFKRKATSEPPVDSFQIVQQRVLYSAEQLEAIQKMLDGSGYAYDEQQNMFYAVQDQWQRNYGYCSLYDEASAPLGMVLDCEPVYFEYAGKRWLIEFWKGQYGITAGGEIGVYNTTWPDLNIPGVFNGTFYQCASDEDTLDMTFTIYNKNSVMFTRTDRHWLLAGFRLGDYARPSHLTMQASLTFKDTQMRDAFLQGLRNAGYTDSDFSYSDNTVSLIYAKPRSKQPVTRRVLIGYFALRRNRRMVSLYRRLTRGLFNMVDILTTLQSRSPVLYGMAVNFGKKNELFKSFETIKDHMK